MAERSVVVGLPAGSVDRCREHFRRHYLAGLRDAIRRVGPDRADEVAEDVFPVVWRRIGEALPEPETLRWHGIASRVAPSQAAVRSHRTRRCLATELGQAVM